MKNLRGKKIVIAGGSGFVGISLAKFLTHHESSVTILSRRQPVAGNWAYRNWDGRTVGDWTTVFDGADAIVNLAGRSVNCIKTPENQDQILRSRVESTRTIGLALREIKSPPPVWCQMSTAHIYGDPPVFVCDEDSTFGYGFAPFVAQAWEREFESSKLSNQRGVLLRTSFVIGKNHGAGGGALDKLGWLARMGLGGTVGDGTQGMSWIHESDMNRIFAKAITDPTISGKYIASSPNPVSQKDFMRKLRTAVGMPWGMPAFRWMVRIAAPVFLNTDPELGLYGRYVIPKRLSQGGFKFKFPKLDGALREIYGV